MSKPIFLAKYFENPGRFYWDTHHNLLGHPVHKLVFSYIVVFGVGLNCYKSKSVFPLIIRVIDDEVLAYYVTYVLFTYVPHYFNNTKKWS